MNQALATSPKVFTPGLWVLILLGIFGVGVFLLQYDNAFPAASIDLKISKPDITLASEKLAKELGYDPQGAVKSTLFDFDNDAKTFLEYEMGGQKANELMRHEIPIWYWRTHFCKPFNMEDISIFLATDGSFSAFNRTIENDRAVPTITHEKAEAMAREFAQKYGRLPLSRTKVVQQGQIKQVKRTDHYFTWEDTERDYKGGKLRVYIYLAGDIVTRFNTYLHVPDAFDRKYDEMRSYNDDFQRISEIIYSLLNSAIFFVFLWAFAAKKIRWKFAIAVSVGVTLLGLLAWLNDLPTLIAAYSTTMSFNGYMASKVMDLARSSIGTLLETLAFVGAVEAIYRKMFPKQLALENVLLKAGLRSVQMRQAVVVAICVFCMHIAYVAAYYVIGKQFNIWAPLDVRDSSVLSSLAPAFSALHVGVQAAGMEELMYRVLALFLFQRLTKNFWLSNLLQAASWAFMHSNYPQEPAYARGVELTICGSFYGWILSKYGLVPCFLAHYVYDAFIGVLPLFSSPDIVARASAVVPLLPLPALLLAGLYFARLPVGKVEAEAKDPAEPEGAGTIAADWVSGRGLTNDCIAEPVPKAEAADTEEHHPFHYKALTGKARSLLVLAAVVMLGLQFLPKKSVLPEWAVTVSGKQALAEARKYLQSRHVNTEKYMTVAYITNSLDGNDLQYLFEKSGYDKTKEVCRSSVLPIYWGVRFFKPKDPTEYVVTIDAKGRPWGVDLTMPEDVAGATPEESVARAQVEHFLNSEHSELAPYKLEDSRVDKHTSRTDYDFQYTCPQLKVAEAEYEVSSDSIGDFVSGMSIGWKVPDQWLFERSKVKLKDQIVSGVVAVRSIVLFLAGVWWLIGVARSQPLSWRKAIVVGLVPFVTTLVTDLNGLPIALASYQVDSPFANFVIEKISSDMISLGGAVTGSILLAAFAFASLRLLTPVSFKSLWEAMRFADNDDDRRRRRKLWTDALVTGYGAMFIFTGISQLADVVRGMVSPSVPVDSYEAVSGVLDLWSPAVSTLCASVSSGVLLCLLAPICAGVAAKYAPTFGRFLLIAFIYLLIDACQFRYWQDGAANLAESLVTCVVAYFLVARVFRMNVPAYFLVGYGYTIWAALVPLAKHAGEVCSTDCVTLLAAFLLPVAFVIWLSARDRGVSAIASGAVSDAQ